MAVTKADNELDTHVVYRWPQTCLAGAQAESIVKCSHYHCRIPPHDPPLGPTFISTPSLRSPLLYLSRNLVCTSDLSSHPPRSSQGLCAFT